MLVMAVNLVLMLGMAVNLFPCFVCLLIWQCMPLSMNTYMLCGMIVDMVLLFVCIVSMIMVLDVPANSVHACGGCSEDSDCYYCRYCCCKFGLLVARDRRTYFNNFKQSLVAILVGGTGFIVEVCPTRWGAGRAMTLT